jgi:hypothetical protein
MMDGLDIRIPVCLSDSLDDSQYKIPTSPRAQQSTYVHTLDVFHRTERTVSITPAPADYASYLYPALPASEAPTAGTTVFDVICAKCSPSS